MYSAAGRRRRVVYLLPTRFRPASPAWVRAPSHQRLRQRTDGRTYLAERYAERLGKVKVGKSSISFTSVDDVDLQQLSELITEAKRLMT